MLLIDVATFTQQYILKLTRLNREITRKSQKGMTITVHQRQQYCIFIIWWQFGQV